MKITILFSGSTDSEHAFALLLHEIGDCDRELSATELADAVERTINRITAMQKVRREVDKGGCNC